MKKTIGFSNKNNVWTSKYDYIASNYSNIDKKFFSSNKLINDGNVAWRHNIGTNNSFYGNTYPSTVAVAFSANPSQNKLYKSMSIEGAGEYKNGVNLFTTSDFISPSGRREYVSAGLISNYGGNKYAHLGKDPRIRPTADLKYMGHMFFRKGFDLMESSLGNNLYKLPISGLAVGVGQGAVNRTKLVFKSPRAANIVSIYGGQQEAIQQGMMYNDVRCSINIASTEDLESVGLKSAYQNDGIVVKATAVGAIPALAGLISQTAESGLTVFALIDPRHAGDMMRGQFAEAHFTLGAQDFELYALNLNYEQTDLDHSK